MNVTSTITTLAITGSKVEAPLAFVIASKREILSCLAASGAVLLRLGEPFGAEIFEHIVSELLGPLAGYRERRSHRRSITGHILSASETAPSYRIGLHNESSYAREWPRYVALCCNVAPFAQGRTPIASSAAVRDLLPTALVERFRQKAILYERVIAASGPYGWQEVFQVADREELEGYLEIARITWDWSRNGDLRIQSLRPGLLRHPKTGREVWFNQAHLFHQGLRELRSESPDRLVPDHSGRDSVTYGDGEPITLSDLRLILAAYDAATQTFSWEEGDVLLLDNIANAHGREPFSGPRNVWVALAGTMSWSEAAELDLVPTCGALALPRPRNG
jgi:alpha-ketoglutarate-dependent taurine dioxygenase